MKREVRETKDGSKTLYIESLDEHYHSFHGALQESKHVFIQYGLREAHKSSRDVRILEVGFGTGLNAFLTYIEGLKDSYSTVYETLEAFPLSQEEWESTQYDKIPQLAPWAKVFNQLHQCPWDLSVPISENFTLIKRPVKLQDFSPTQKYDLIYYDAFAPSAQPELWTEDIFEELFALTAPGGSLVTYCAKGQVKRNMKAAGYLVTALPGPPGKREMTRAQRNTTGV